MDTSVTNQERLSSYRTSVDMTSPGISSPGFSQPLDIVDTTVVKRKPGRPKGSGKKSISADTPSVSSTNSKMKRPVGRPRKDGLPAGSGPRRSQSQKTAVKTGADSFTSSRNVSFPLMGSHGTWQHDSASSIDPDLQRDQWVDMWRKKPIAFLDNLIASLASPYPQPNGGPTVDEAFTSHLVSLSAKSAQSQANPSMPTLYSILKTFWLPTSPPYFTLTASVSSARTPSDHRFLYWDPQPIVFNGIACPSCSAPLVNQGCIHSGPVKIYDLEKPFFIIGCEYACQSEGRKYASTDSSILRSLPVGLKDEFPALLRQGDRGSGKDVWNWQAVGVSKSLWNMVRGSLKVGMGRDAILNVVRSIQFGVSEESERREEEESETEDERFRGAPVQVGGESQHVSEALHGATVDSDENQDHAADAYNDAWKGNSISDSNNMAISSSSSTSMGEVAHRLEMSDGSSSQSGPYVPYPGAQYSRETPANASSSQPSISASQRSSTSTFTSKIQNPSVSAVFRFPSSPSASEQSILKRTYDAPSGPAASGLTTLLEPSAKRIRHCCKCGSGDCKGKGGRTFCMNSCQDCGKLECKGRNSRKPDKPCSEAWL